MRKNPFVMLLAATSLASCSVYQKYETGQTAPDVPSDLFGTQMPEPVDTTATLGALPWQEVFTDPELRQLISTALADNVDVRQAELHVSQAQASLHAARLGYLPSLAFTPSGVLSSFDWGKSTKVYELPLVASWQLPLFGNAVTNQHRLAGTQAEQAEAIRQNVCCQVVTATANLYYTLAMLQSQLATMRDMRQDWQQSVSTMEKLMRAGQGDQVAVSQMQAAQKGVEISIVEMERQQHDVRNALCLLSGKAAGSLDMLSPQLQSFTFPAQASVGVPLQLLQYRPDVRASERQLAAAYYQVQLARAQLYPNITLSGSAGFTNSVGSVIINPGKALLSAVASLTQPIFARGQLKANLKIRQAEQEAAQLSFTNTLLQAGIEVNDALAAAHEARQKEQLYEAQIVALERALRSTTLLMEHGSNTYLDVLTARQSLQQARLGQSANQLLTIQSVLSLYAALGGGSSQPSATAP